MRKLIFLLMAVALGLSAASCKKKSTESDFFAAVSCDEPDDTLNTYSQKISTILNTNCVKAPCHNSSYHKHNVNLEGYPNAANSFQKQHILCAITWEKGCKPMPRNAAKLSDADIHDITCWAKNGYPE